MTTPLAQPTFTVLDIAPEPYSTTPRLAARIGITASTEPVHAVALRCQVRINPMARAYTDAEAHALSDLFGARERWADTQRSFLWQHCSTVVPGFTGAGETTMYLECTYDFEVSASRYLHALSDGVVPLQFMFSGTLFSKGTGGFSVQQVPWDCDDDYAMPVQTWRDLIAQHYPDTSWLRLRHDTIAALARFKAVNGAIDLDDAVTTLLIRAEALQ